MNEGARRLLVRGLHRPLRRAQLLVCTLIGITVGPLDAGAQEAEPWQTAPLLSARFTEPTMRYPHGVLGDTIEHGALELTYGNPAQRIMIRLPQVRVFEDTNPRLADVDGDGQAEVIVVESHQSQGARLSIYNGGGLIAATPYIGQRNRWLAPVAIADLDGDGRVELAYIDRPHLAKTLRVWRFNNEKLTEIASLQGLTNHRIGERDIAGGLRNCTGTPEMIVARADWQEIMSVTFDGTGLHAREVSPFKGRPSFLAALACK